MVMGIAGLIIGTTVCRVASGVEAAGVVTPITEAVIMKAIAVRNTTVGYFPTHCAGEIQCMYASAPTRYGTRVMITS